MRWQLAAGATGVLLRAAGGYGTDGLPRHRQFVLGGRGTTLGEPFRGLVGARMMWASAEWQLPVRVPEIRMGSFAGTGRQITVSPNLGAGWMEVQLPGLTTIKGSGSVGLGVAWLHDLLRFDVGYGIVAHRVGFTVDVSRSFWDIL